MKRLKMKLKELKAREIIQMVMGKERISSKSDEELALILKKRLTKKECEALNAQVNGTVDALEISDERYEALIASAIKKIKNESVHGDFFYTKGE